MTTNSAIIEAWRNFLHDIGSELLVPYFEGGAAKTSPQGLVSVFSKEEVRDFIAEIQEDKTKWKLSDIYGVLSGLEELRKLQPAPLPPPPLWNKLVHAASISNFPTFLKASLEESLRSFLDQLPETDVRVEYWAPCDLSHNKKLYPLVSTHNRLIVPVVEDGNKKQVDFRFLRGDLVRKTPEIQIVTQLKEYLDADVCSVNVLVGPSGSVKTRAQFDVARNQYSLYFEVPDVLGTSGSADVDYMIELLRNNAMEYCRRAAYYELTNVQHLIRVLLFSRVFYMEHIKHKVSPEKWLLMQLPTTLCHRKVFQNIFSFCLWLTLQFPYALNDMRDYLQSRDKTVVCVDAANNLFDTLEGVFMKGSTEPDESNKQTVSFARPFIYGMLKEFKQPYVVAGTAMRLKLLEQASGIAKFSSADRIIPAWRELNQIEYLEDSGRAEAILSMFVTLGNVMDIAREVVGRFQFLLGFLVALFEVIMSTIEPSDAVTNIVQRVFCDYKAATVFSGANSLVRSITKIHHSSYATVFLEHKIVNIPEMLLRVAFASMFKQGYYYASCDAAIDYISLGCLTFSRDVNAWTVGELWAIQALLRFYKLEKLDIEKAVVHGAMMDSLQVSGVKDSVKGKMLEWLVAMRLREVYGQPVVTLPIFAQASATPGCPQWFQELANFSFSKIEVDLTGNLMELVLRDNDQSTIVLPVKEARPDVSTRNSN